MGGAPAIVARGSACVGGWGSGFATVTRRFCGFAVSARWSASVALSFCSALTENHAPGSATRLRAFSFAPPASRDVLVDHLLTRLDMVAAHTDAPSSASRRSITPAGSWKSGAVRRLATSVTWTRPSAPPLYAACQLSSIATLHTPTPRRWTLPMVCTHRRWPTSHKRIVPSLDPVMHNLPVGSIAAHRAFPVCPRSFTGAEESRASHTRTVPAEHPDTIVVPVASMASAYAESVCPSMARTNAASSRGADAAGRATASMSHRYT